ncbi:MAG: FAD-dependent 5-carboxymethylaminomethyl-2-thiouridine(34) oxidoreductase MnmC [Brevundimonas sp.]|uniref:FAD-dependent 5-carboxymethylaminomethyl-2-thiouridine(34) oxidoreductase MnmC n=1 Tax=Brevundimonas sp. TaxID=1871086 RepID=UPI001A3592F7|nr:FAD-dependent 5-carboxymethylaminomethyl-2-thiouridine(34) oxidoreductase MnmC [Brevundimonas sp.]MBJ7447566.1 FAD-dependent 5-carboxymethylaminomethyl-2-thiouridine(34) oxidoreductase MnmC [Brevundimonas sp.]
MSDDRSPRLLWEEDGAPRSGRFDDVYFSKEDGLAESRAVFLAGCGLPEAWVGRRHFTVAELGFGTGLNIVALLDLWRRERPAGGHLHILSVEGFPLSRDEAARALSAWPEVTEITEVLLDRWPSGMPGFHRLNLYEFGATLDLAIGDAAWALDQWSGRADAWFLDGFAPSTNPGMWSDAVMDAIAARSAPGARVATFTVAGAVRRGLSERGFQVDKRPGHGRKRERLEARLPGAITEPQASSIAVIGAGIAGASLARAFAALGHRVTVVEAEAAGAGGSGFPAALVTPRLDAGDADIAALHAQALTLAGDLYGQIEGAVVAKGVLQLEQAPRDAGRFRKIADQPIWSADAMTVVDATAASAHLGEAVYSGGLMMASALAVRPASVLEAWLGQADRLTASVASIQRTDRGWSLLSDAGEVVLEVDVVILAAGWGNAGLAADLALAPVRGQADWVEDDTLVAPAVAWGGYRVPIGRGVLFGATHDRGRTDTVTSAEDTARNLSTLTARLPRARHDLPAAIHSRAAVRATTPDRLPLAGAVPGTENLYVLGGLGSRGFCVAPLLAEHVAALVTNTPSPLPRDLAARVSPSRTRATPPLAEPPTKSEA